MILIVLTIIGNLAKKKLSLEHLVGHEQDLRRETKFSQQDNTVWFQVVLRMSDFSSRFIYQCHFQYVVDIKQCIFWHILGPSPRCVGLPGVTILYLSSNFTKSLFLIMLLYLTLCKCPSFAMMVFPIVFKPLCFFSFIRFCK